MANLTIDVKDLTVPELCHSNIAIINQPNPVKNFSASDDQIFFLINFSKYKVTESATGKIINGENYYEYFPDKNPHGGGGGGGTPDFTEEQWATINRGLTADDKISVAQGRGLTIMKSGDKTLRLIIPHMTADRLPYGYTIESGHYQTRYAYLAFNGIDTQTWQNNSWSDGTNELDGTPDKCYVGYVFANNVKIHDITISFSSDTTYTGCIQCRLNNEWRTIVDNIPIEANPGASYYTKLEYTLEQDEECDAIRFSVLSGDQPKFCESFYGGNVCEMIVNGYDSVQGTVLALTPASKSSFGGVIVGNGINVDNSGMISTS